MSIDKSGALDYHIQHPSKTPADGSIKNPCPPGQKTESNATINQLIL